MTLTAPLGENSVLREFAERGQAAQAAADKAVADAEAQTKEEQQNMGKEDMKEGKAAEDYTQIERRAVLEATRGLGERAMKAEAGKLGISRTTIYKWRKELWGTGNAYGIADKKATARPAAPKAGRGGPHRSEEEKRRIVEEAYAYPGGLRGYHAKHGVPDVNIRRWAKALGIERPAIDRVASNGKRLRTAEEKLRILAEADAHPGGIKAYAEASGLGSTMIHQWKAAQKDGRLKASSQPSKGAKPTSAAAKVSTDGRLYRTDAEKLRHVAAAEKHPGGFRAYSRENRLSASSIDKWRARRDRGELTASDAISRAGKPIKVEAAPDAEIVERYEQERALKRVGRPGPDPRDAKIKALEIENLALKVNVRAAMMAGYLSFLDVDSMFSGKKG